MLKTPHTDLIFGGLSPPATEANSGVVPGYVALPGQVNIKGRGSFDRDRLVSLRIGKGDNGIWYFMSRKIDKDTLNITTIRHTYTEKSLAWLVVTFFEMNDGTIAI